MFPTWRACVTVYLLHLMQSVKTVAKRFTNHLAFGKLRTSNSYGGMVIIFCSLFNNIVGLGFSSRSGTLTS